MTVDQAEIADATHVAGTRRANRRMQAMIGYSMAVIIGVAAITGFVAVGFQTLAIPSALEKDEAAYLQRLTAEQRGVSIVDTTTTTSAVPVEQSTTSQSAVTPTPVSADPAPSTATTGEGASPAPVAPVAPVAPPATSTGE
ncbi:hypothetical protein ACFPVT_09530 [Corynebacterium choanae]|uniref:Uncharacterized protein n=1 Tax=Corynebacterium choanae TaxID=1862358 RepID=A0A3G6J8N5_9CORY|nr:hypothetical protein [Corynebacterium choanae]AZA14269.1 hypothetical protein CCHOA_09430 [Corynebacterium choanae]